MRFYFASPGVCSFEARVLNPLAAQGQSPRRFRSTTPFRWRSSTITACWPREPRFSRARRKKSPPICGRSCAAGRFAVPARLPAQSQFSSDYIDNTAQFDLGVSYLFERGKKRQHRLQAAKDTTAVTRSQVPTTSAP
jgi:hypothetical protein